MEISIKGLPVSKEYYAMQQPAISNGIFAVKNNTSGRLRVDSVQIKVIVNKEEIPVSEFYIYQLPEYNEILQPDFYLEPFADITIDVSFPFVYNGAGSFNNIKVAISLLLNKKVFSGLSPVTITIRMN